jgi:hypothetical protein
MAGPEEESIMKRFAPIRTAAAIALAGILSAGAADASTLATAALRLGDVADFSCLFTNTGNREMRVDIRMIHKNGAIAGSADPLLAPGETFHMKNPTPSGETMRCQFEFSGNAKYARGLACVSTEAGGCLATAPAY